MAANNLSGAGPSPSARAGLFGGALGPLLAAVRDGDVSTTEIVARCLGRIASMEPEIQCFAHVDPDRVRREALALERLPPDGRPLYGLPIAVKDTIDVEDWPTEAGSKVLSGNIAHQDAPVVARLREAGAIVVGKTTTHELAFGTLTPPTRNPRDVSRIPGGSSGGSAAAVAAGMVPAAIGTDTVGSITVPAALCGVCGLRPTPGAVPSAGTVPLVPSLDVVGPLARQASDLGLLFAVMAERPVPHLDNTEGKAVGYVENASLGRVDPEIGAAVLSAVDGLSRTGLVVRELSDLDLSESPRAWAARILDEALECHRSVGWYPARKADYGSQVEFQLRFAEDLGEDDIVASKRAAHAVASALRSALQDVDAVVIPAVPEPTPRRDEPWVQTEDSPDRLTPRLTRLTAPVSFAGLAAVTLPCGKTSLGLPIGMQVIALREQTALSIASVCEVLVGGFDTN